ncbi:DUF1579 family protein [Nonomuraea pusilla]|uniref:DUF1579 family protein n=1 Tax=Nonomuraea pusilla TaxID=46177 RepID=UPI00331D6D34
MVKRTTLFVVAAATILSLTGTPSASAAVTRSRSAPPAAWQARTPGADLLEPGSYHHRLDRLVGTWKAVKYNYLLGEDGKPVVSRDITVRTRWMAKTGGRFLKEETEGTLAGHRYYRLGVLGFSSVDHRYEWTTFDSVTPTAMTYRGPALTEATDVLSIPGSFTDPGILGPKYLGKTIPMRTVIKIRSNDRHTFEIYFTPPGRPERLVDRVVYTRASA